MEANLQVDGIREWNMSEGVSERDRQGPREREPSKGELLYTVSESHQGSRRISHRSFASPFPSNIHRAWLSSGSKSKGFISDLIDHACFMQLS